LIIEFIASAIMSVTIVKVSDGDTCTASDGTKIRLVEIDAPETKQKHGKESRDVLAALVLNEKVTLDAKKKDKYGRTLGTIYIGTRPDGTPILNINEAMVLSGNAWAYMIPKDSYFREFENIARKDKRGLWADPNPTPPWEFRKNVKK
jgi:micrococcal nuclease